MGRRTIKDKYRDVYGYDYHHSCGECKYKVKMNARQRTVYKCLKIGITSSTATDIRLKDSSCKQFEEAEDE
jgi:hypothetical protein